MSHAMAYNRNFLLLVEMPPMPSENGFKFHTSSPAKPHPPSVSMHVLTKIILQLM